MKLHASSFLSKLLGFSLLLGTFPVIVLGTFSYFKASGTVQTKVYESNQQLLQQTESQIEQLLRLVDYSAIQYMSLPLVTSALRGELHSTSSGVSTVKDLLESMSKLQSNDLGMMSMQLVSLAHGWSVGSTGLSELSAQQLGNFDDWIGDPRTSFWRADPTTVKLIKKIPTYAAQPTGLLVVSVPAYEINKLLGGGTKLGSVLVMDEARRVFSGNDGMNAGKRLKRLPFGGNTGSFETTPGFYKTYDGKERVGVSYRVSPYNGWVYMSVVSIGQLDKEARDIGWFTLYLCIGIVAAALLLSYLGSRKMYRPIRSLYDIVRNLPDEGRKAATSDEFALINERFRGLLQQETRLLQEVQGQTRQMKEYFMFKLFQSDMAREEIRDKMLLFGDPPGWESMCVMAIQIDTLSETRFREEDRDLLLFAVNNIVAELIAAERRLPPVVMGESQVTLLGAAEADAQTFKAQLDSLAQLIMKSVNRFLELKISIGFSRIFADFKQIRQAYGEALTALKYRMKLGEESILFIGDVQPEQGVPQHYPDDLERELLDALKLADREQASRALPALIAAIAADNRTHEEYFMSFVRLLLQMLQAVKDAGVHPGKLNMEEQALFSQLFQLRTVGEVEQWFRQEVADPLLHHLERRREAQYQSISSEIVHLIETGFDSDLTLEVCARRMNYSPNYLSKVFRKETGVNFSDYLAEYRLRMAQKWLTETDMKIAEIADKLKYNTPANFIRYFRKMEGMTPGQYREKHWDK